MARGKFGKPYKLAAFYDTETTNMERRAEREIQHFAFPVLFIVNALECDVSEYIPNVSDNIAFYRDSSAALEAFENLIEKGLGGGYIPIVAAYNLMFDLQPLRFQLAQRYDMQANAQNSVTVYTLDLLDANGNTVLRFWDTFFLEMNGLSAMGDACGFPKATGKWNYDLPRAPQTPLSDDELEYARRDVQVIPAYLKWILETNPHIASDDLGVKVLTKTSLVRQLAKRSIAPLRVIKDNGKVLTLLHAFKLTCKQELPLDYASYGTRKACFRGGFTFTSARFSMLPVENVASLDVVSMHHAFINGRYLPVHFWKARTDILNNLVAALETYTLDMILRDYHKPFPFAFHGHFRLCNLRLKAGSAFEHWQIGLLSAAKFARRIVDDSATDSAANIVAENAIRKSFRDRAINPVFAFGKLYSAEIAEIYVNEIELWNVIQVYDFDSIEALDGEATFKFIVPPDYVTLQSNYLYRLKSEMKGIVKGYIDGCPYNGTIGDSVPETIAAAIEAGSVSADFLQSYYTITVKGQFNSIYGTQAQDLYKPSFKVENGELLVDVATVPNEDNFESLQPENPLVCYTYGQRIVAGSRMHLLCAIMLLHSALENRVDVLAGDTDSLKIRCDSDVSESDLLQALQPLHVAVDAAIAYTQRRIRREFPELTTELEGIGNFEVENSGAFYLHHMEAWNKARISYDGKEAHITCAGLSRPYGEYNIESAADELIERYGFDEAAPLVLRFNNWIHPSLSHSLGHSVPPIGRRYAGNVTDYMGESYFVDEYESIALYPIGRMLGSSMSMDNRWTMDFLGDRIESRVNMLSYVDDELKITRL